MFKALADPTRRALLDLLRAHDGRTLVDLQAHFDVSRQAVMRHLRVLEDAGLVHTRKVGRERHHYLNAIPIQIVYDRWVEPFARPAARALTALKRDLEAPMPTPTAKMPPTKALEIHIQTTPEELWDALTNPDRTEKYYFGARLESSLEPGAPYAYTYPDGSVLHDGEVVEVTPYERLVMTFRPLFNLPEGGDPDDLNVSRMVFEITQEGPTCKLVLTYEDLDESDTVDGYISGSSRIFSGLKTLLESGAPMTWQRPDGDDAG